MAARRSWGNRPPMTDAARTTVRASVDNAASRAPRTSRSNGGMDGWARSPGLGEHLDVEGQPARSFEHRLDLDRLRRPPEDPAELLLDFSAIERGQLDALDAADPAKLGEQAHERVPPMQVIGSVGRDDRDPLARHVPDQEPDQVAGRAVRPLEVFDREHDGAVTRDPAEGAEDRVEQPRLTAHGIGPIVRRRFRRRATDQGRARGGRGRRPTVRRRPCARPRPATVRATEAPRRTGRRAGRPHRDRGSPRGASGHRRRATRSASSASSRLFPTPASPATRTNVGSARVARSKASSSRPSSARRPTNAWLLSRRVMPPIMRSSRPLGKAGGQPFVGGSGVDVGSSVSARPGRPGIPIRHQTNSRTASDHDHRDEQVERLERLADLLPVRAEHGARIDEQRRPDEGARGRIDDERPDRHARDAGREADERPDDGQQPPDEHGGRAVAREERIGQLDLVRPDEQVLPVPLEERPPAVGADRIGDQRAERVPDRRHDDHDPEVPRLAGDRLELARVGHQEAGVREDELGWQRDHRRLDRHGGHDAEVADRPVQVVEERDDEVVDEGEHADLWFAGWAPGSIADYPRHGE